MKSQISSFLTETKLSTPATGASFCYVESAGGVHSPTPSGTSQLDVYRALRPNVVLIGDSKLGGISTTISAFESLQLHGYPVSGVILFENEKYMTHDYISRWFQEKGIHVSVVPSPPTHHSSQDTDLQNLVSYYKENTVHGTPYASFRSHLLAEHESQLERLASLKDRTLQHVWWPFTQYSHVSPKDPMLLIDSAHGDHFHVLDEAGTGTTQVFDGSASWWTQCLGHADGSVARAAAYAAAQYGHVMFPTAAHEPGTQLAETILDFVGGSWASKVFFSDDGSTAMEVALKMALHYTAESRKLPEAQAKNLKILGLQGSYHGDTMGNMMASEESPFNAKVEWYSPRGYWLAPPLVVIQDGVCYVKDGDETYMFPDLQSVYNLDKRREDALACAYANRIDVCLRDFSDSIGGLVIEPLILGAGGMLFVDPLFQRMLVDKCKAVDIPVIFDEVFTGLYRAGYKCASQVLGCEPDISCYAKILSGGLVPLALTLASSKIFEAFLGASKQDALLHGHSYTGYPVGCSVALQTLREIQTLDEKTKSWEKERLPWHAQTTQDPWSFWSPSLLRDLSSSPNVAHAMALGTVLAIRMKSSGSGYESMASQGVLRALMQRGIHCRSLGDTFYVICSLNSSVDDIEKHLRECVTTGVE